METGLKLITSEISCGFSMEYRCVMGNGAIRFIEKKEEKLCALKVLMQHYTQQEMPYHEKMLQKVCVFALDVEEISCKANMQANN